MNTFQVWTRETATAATLLTVTHVGVTEEEFGRFTGVTL